MMLRYAQKRTLSSKRNLSPLIGAALCSSLVFISTQSHANTLGTLSIPSANLPADDKDGDVSAALLNSASLQSAVVAKRAVKLLPGDTLDKLLAREGVAEDQRAAALKSLADLFDASTLKAGDTIEFSMRAVADASSAQLVALRVMTGSAQDLTIVAGNDGAFHPLGKHYAQTPDSKKWSVVVTERKGTIKHSLMADLVAANVPQTIADDVAAAFTYDPSIPVHPAKGSVFSVVYETASAGRAANAQNVLRYASLVVDGQEHRVYRYETKDGTVAFMEENGRGVKPFRLASPVRDARMTSPWGWRVHPVLKVRKFHKGVDFAAPKGTPVYAAEDGVVETVGWRGNYGRYVKIGHNERLATAYAHLAGFAKGLHRGSKVKRGDVIAYIGASGLATGNHLYYEVLVDNKQVDPTRPDIMVQVNLDGSALVRFKTYVAEVSQETPQP